MRITVRPGEHRTVRLQDGRVLNAKTTPPEGENLPWSLYLQRRLDCGDLVLVEADAEVKTSAAADQKPAPAGRIAPAAPQTDTARAGA